MKHFATALALLIALLAQAALAAEPPKLIRCPGLVCNVVDGDTLDVKIQMYVEILGVDDYGNSSPAAGDELPLVVRVRLLADTKGRGCWAPESRTKDAAEKKRGLAAKKRLEGIALGMPCTVVVTAKSYRVIDYLSMERVLAVVEVEGKSLGESQIKAKLASSTKGGRLGT